MKVPELCYLLIVFSVHPLAQELMEKKLESKPSAYQRRIRADIAKLAKDALVCLHESQQTEKSHIYLSLANRYSSSLHNLSLNLSSSSAGGYFGIGID